MIDQEIMVMEKMAGFDEPGLLLFLLLIPFAYLLVHMASQKKKREAMKFSNISFIKSALGDKKKSRFAHLLLWLSLVSIILMIVGFAGPHIPLKQAREGVTVVLALDVSGSMMATDYSPNRHEASKAAAKVLLESLEDKDNAGIVVFESGATTAAYLSPFKEQVIKKLGSIAVKEGRTAIGDGLSLAVDMATSIPNKKKVVILLSDGVSNAGVISPSEAVQFAKSNKIQVYTIGMGSDEPVILGYSWFGQPQYAELDEDTLIAIAQQTGGKYFKSVDEKTLSEIYKSISEDIEREKEETDVSSWLFFAALVLIVVQLYLRYGRRMIIQ